MGKRGHAAHHGGAWKVAYADFVTAMMALFIVLWLLSQTDKDTKQQLSEYFRTGVFSGAPSVLMGGTGIQEGAFLDTQGKNDEVQQLSSTAAEIANILTQSADEKTLAGIQDHVRVSVTDEGLLIQIVDGGDDEVLFDLSSAALKPRLIDLLKRIGPLLARIGLPLQLHGHTDGRPFPAGSGKDNWQLSFQRADNARAILEGSGVKHGQVIGVHAHADTVPLDTDPNAPSNRRLSILAVRPGMERRAGAPDAKLKGKKVEEKAAAVPAAADAPAEPAAHPEHGAHPTPG